MQLLTATTITEQCSFLTGSLKNRVKEEKNASDLVTKMELFGDDSRALYMLNSELKKLVHTHQLHLKSNPYNYRYYIEEEYDMILNTNHRGEKSFHQTQCQQQV